MAEVSIIIEADGKVSLDVEGVRGNECIQIVKPLVTAIGELKHEQKKPCFYQGAHTKQSVNIFTSR